MNNKKIRMDIWDTAGQERFKNIAKNYYKDAHAVIFVFDVNIKKTTEKIKYWLDDAGKN
jgi:small GTP-binding protein